MSTDFQHIAQDLEKTGQAYLSKDDFLEGLTTFLQKNQLKTAARYYRQSNEDVGYPLIEFAKKEKLALPLAKVFLMARDYYKAAQVFEYLNMHKESAQSYEKAEAYSFAADLYGKVGDTAKCADMLERAGSYAQAAKFFSDAKKWDDAARNYAKAEDHFRAGEAYAKSNDHRKALDQLQKVPKENRDYLESVRLLGPILEKLGFSELAILKYQETIESRPPVEAAPITYSLGRLYERLGQAEEAKQLYAKVLEVDLDYKDVQKRYVALRDKEEPLPDEMEETIARRLTVSESQSDYPGLVILDDDQSFFEKCVLFQDLSLDEMHAVFQHADKRTFTKDETVVRESDQFEGLSVIHKGTVNVFMKIDGKQVRVSQVGPGDHFGELTVLKPHKARVTLHAVTDGAYVVIPRDKMGALLDRNLSLRAKILTNTMLALDEHIHSTVDMIRALWIRSKKLGQPKK